MDVVAAFMNGKLEETVYLELPKGWNELIGQSGDAVAKLNAALYGLTQAARVFYDTVRRYLVNEHGMAVCPADGCLVTMPGLYGRAVCG